MNPYNTETRIELQDTVFDVITKMSEGVPGAITVLVQTVNTSPTVDPDDFMGGLGPLLSLDMYGIYGSNIWILFKYCCNSNINGFLTVLRACQMGVFDIRNVIKSIESQSPINVSEILLKLKEQLPNFSATL